MVVFQFSTTDYCKNCAHQWISVLSRIPKDDLESAFKDLDGLVNNHPALKDFVRSFAYSCIRQIRFLSGDCSTT